jgi:hypothetical protein
MTDAGRSWYDTSCLYFVFSEYPNNTQAGGKLMFCNSCGREIEDGSAFCGFCGVPLENSQQRSEIQQDQQVQQAPKKKRKKGCLISVIVLLAILIGLGYLAASLLGLFGPKNLGVKYDEGDYSSAMEKIGTEIIYEDMSGAELREHTRDLKKDNVQYPIADYEWIHENFERRQFELTENEATAFINEIAPAFFWFERVQIDVEKGGEVSASGTLRLRKALEDNYPDLIDQVPFPVFKKVNLYASGGISISDNELSLSADEFKTGAISGISAEMLNDNARYFEPLYTSVPGLEIYSLEITDDGKIAVDALIPQRTTVRRIGG